MLGRCDKERTSLSLRVSVTNSVLYICIPTRITFQSQDAVYILVSWLLANDSVPSLHLMRTSCNDSDASLKRLSSLFSVQKHNLCRQNNPKTFDETSSINIICWPKWLLTIINIRTFLRRFLTFCVYASRRSGVGAFCVTISLSQSEVGLMTVEGR